MVADVTIKAVIEHTPGLRESIRDLLDGGKVPPAEVLRRYGSRSALYRRHPMTALTIEWIVDEWQRDRGLVKPDESIDRVEDLL
jgi:hypothetical protein